MPKETRKTLERLSSGLAIALITPVLTAGPITLPNTFQNGVIADANDVNTNFNTLVTESNAQDTRITQLENAPSPQPLGGLICSAGEVTKWNGAAWICGTDFDTDTNTTYAAGAGLTLSSTVFSIPVRFRGCRIAYALSTMRP